MINFIKTIKYITADIARYGDDTTVICLWYNNFITKIYSFNRQDLKETRLFIEKLALQDLKKNLEECQKNDITDTDSLQYRIFEIGKLHFSQLKDWFMCLYEVLLGQKEGPRMGSFIAVYGLKETHDLIDLALERQ